MALFSDPIDSLVFKRSIRDDTREFSLTRQMLQVLIELDGVKNLTAVNQSLGLNLSTLKNIISKLHQLQLIEKVNTSLPVLTVDFFDFLKNQLSLAIGPIAEFMVEDEVRQFMNESEQIRVEQAAELVDLLSRQIQRPEKRVAFQQSMLKKINEIMRD